MVMQISATSCWTSVDLIKKYGDDLKKFGATINGIAIDEVKITEEYSEERFDLESSKVEIEINSLEVIRDFIGTFGKIVIGNNSIEIYDSYRE